MDIKIVSRYLMGLIKFKAKDKTYLPREIKSGDDRIDLMFDVITKLRGLNSAMTPEILLGTSKEMFNELDDDSDWMEHEPWFESVIFSSVDCDIEEEEISELYSIIQRERINQVAKRMLEELMDGEFSEDKLGTTIDRLRLLKAIYPSKIEKLDDQVANAVIEAINDSAGIIPYGIASMDEELGGICRKEVTALGGRPSHGKTSFACQLLINWLEQGFKVLVISKEMSTAKLVQKMISNLGRISSKDIKHGRVEDTEYLETVATGIATKYKDQLFIYEDVYKFMDVEGLILKHKPDIVLDDYLQVTDFDGIPEKELRHKIHYAMRSYKEMSKEYNLAYFILSQLSREIEKRDDPIPRMSDFAESGSIEQVCADALFIYYRFKDTYEKSDKAKVEIIVGKARFGENTMIDIGFDGDHMRYYELPKLKRAR